MTFNYIMISEVKTHYTAEHIAFTLLTKEICHVSSITLIPQIYNGDIYNIAYIDIHSYCDTEAAYEFIEHIKYGIFMLNHDNDPDNVWIFQNNIHNSGQLSVGSFTTHFNHDFNSSIEEYRPILGINNDHYSLNEALDYFHFLNEKWHSVNTAFERRQIEDMIHHIDNELRIHHSLLNSQHVTIR
jgi:hypothetical protein